MCSMVHEEIFKEFCEWSPEYASMVVDHKPWGSTSILVKLKAGMSYKVKRYSADKFVMQFVSEDDIKRKYNKDK